MLKQLQQKLTSLTQEEASLLEMEKLVSDADKALIRTQLDKVEQDIVQCQIEIQTFLAKTSSSSPSTTTSEQHASLPGDAKKKPDSKYSPQSQPTEKSLSSIPKPLYYSQQAAEEEEVIVEEITKSDSKKFNHVECAKILGKSLCAIQDIYSTYSDMILKANEQNSTGINKLTYQLALLMQQHYALVVKAAQNSSSNSSTSPAGLMQKFSVNQRRLVGDNLHLLLNGRAAVLKQKEKLTPDEQVECNNIAEIENLRSKLTVQ